MMWIYVFLCQCLLGANLDQLPKEEIHTLPIVSDTSSLLVLDSFEAFEQILETADNDEVLVINFWATWCAPCVKELPYFESFNKEYSSEKLRVLLVSLDFPKLIEQRVKPAIKKYGLTAELYLLDDPNENEWIDKVDPSWSGTIPATLFVKGNKRIFAEREFDSIEDIVNELNKL